MLLGVARQDVRLGFMKRPLDAVNVSARASGRLYLKDRPVLAIVMLTIPAIRWVS